MAFTAPTLIAHRPLPKCAFRTKEERALEPGQPYRFIILSMLISGLGQGARWRSHKFSSGKQIWLIKGSHLQSLAVAWVALSLISLSLVVCRAADAPVTNLANSLKPNVLRPNDLITVKVYQEEDLETKTTIDKNGSVTLPLLGAVEVGQKTAQEAATIIQELYGKDYLVNPQVSICVVEKAKLRFTVMGQVQKPGTYEFPDNEPLNLLQGLAIAGGYTRLGAPTKITLQRVQNGKPVIHNLNAELMSRDKKTKPFEVLPDDIITVGERVF